MIFVTLGSQKFQFNRMLVEIDKLIEEGKITDEVFAQIGASDYKPRKFKYKDFLTQDEFKDYMKNANLVITHAGTGAIVTALKNDKLVIAIPRLAKYGEHVDDHQIQLIDEFKELNFIEPVYEIEQLANALEVVKKNRYNKYVSNTKNIINDIEKFIEE
jgi:UDP-N-acetylglucosamine transferase subunit ALG13